MPVFRRFLAWGEKIPRIIPILFLGFLHGALYVLIIPPWQHYDEPTQFEYAWLIANQGTLPGPEAFDSGMRREVAASMVEHHFFENLPAPNVLLDKPWIGISQTNDQPLYYLVAAIPLWLLQGADITFQLYAVRTLSLGMFLLTIWISYKIVVEIFPRQDTLQWLVPTALALTPSFVDLMTAVNNDVGATLIFSTFLWGGTRIFTRGVTFFRLFFLLCLALACFFTKNTVFIAIPSIVFLLLLAIAQRCRLVVVFLGRCCVLVSKSLYCPTDQWNAY